MKKHTAEHATLAQKLLAFSVHVLTSTGAIVALLAIIAISDASDPLIAGTKLKEAMLWLFLALIIDGIDGTFARLFRSQEILPNWDGKAMDYVIDFATYAIIPAFFLYQSGCFGVYSLLATIIIVLISSLYYGKEGMVSEGLHFVGFPVMWNMAAFYFYFVLSFSPLVNFILVIITAALHFVPILYPYPSRTKQFQGVNILFTVLFLAMNAWILYIFPERSALAASLSVATVVYFLFVALYYTYTYKSSDDEV